MAEAGWDSPAAGVAPQPPLITSSSGGRWGCAAFKYCLRNHSCFIYLRLFFILLWSHVATRLKLNDLTHGPCLKKDPCFTRVLFSTLLAEWRCSLCLDNLTLFHTCHILFRMPTKDCVEEKQSFGVLLCINFAYFQFLIFILRGTWICYVFLYTKSKS